MEKDSHLTGDLERLYNKAVSRLQVDAYYDAFSLFQTICARLLQREQAEVAARVGFEFANMFVNKNESSLASAVGTAIIDAFRQGNMECTEERVGQVAYLLRRLIDSDDVHIEMLIELCINWTKKGDGQGGSPLLHRIAGEYYQRRCQFGKSQDHLVFCHDADALYCLLLEWKKQGYPNENGYFDLRVLLILLSLKDIMTAQKLVMKCLSIGGSSDIKDAPAALQLGFFLVRLAFLSLSTNTMDDLYAQEANSKDLWVPIPVGLDSCIGLWRHIVHKYGAVISRDPSFGTLMKMIEENFFQEEEYEEQVWENGNTRIITLRRQRRRQSQGGGILHIFRQLIGGPSAESQSTG